MIMGRFLGGFVLPSLLLAAALLNWSLIPLVDLLAFLIIRFTAPKRGFRFRGRFLLMWFIFIYSLIVILVQAIFLILWAFEGSNGSLADAWWAKLLGLMRLDSWRCPWVIYFLVIQIFVALVAFFETKANNFGIVPCQDSWWGKFSAFFDQIGSHLRVASCLLLPAVQLVVGISNPSWVSLPFFICSCVGLVDWSLTSNFSGLFRWWRLIWLYTAINIFLLYVYQLPVSFFGIVDYIAQLAGLYKISTKSEWLEIGSGLSLVLFFLMLSCIKSDLEEMELIMSTGQGSLTDRLLPTRRSFFIRESRSGVRHTNVLLRGSVFRNFSINFFTYGFPVSLLALSLWSFHFASICAFGLLAYVGYVIYAFPSLYRLHRLNGLLLVFILLWAVSTYIFNVAFGLLKIGKDMEVWELVGLWHYSIPGLFLLAQFCLGVLVALGNLVSNSVFLYLYDEDGRTSNDNCSVEGKEETKVLIVATIAWGLRKGSRAIELVLLFLIATKPGFVHAVYIIFFIIYLVSRTINKRIRRSLILLCEAHFATLYILQLNIVSEYARQKGLRMEILSQLGLLDGYTSWDILEMALLACLCAVHIHGFDMLFSFSAIVQHAPCLPVGFSILKAGLNKSVLLSVYSSSTIRDSYNDDSYERKIASYLGAVGHKFLSLYHSFGTYIAFMTIIVAVYCVRPNYVSFGYIFLLLVWITGRQLVEKTKKRLWFPLQAYAIVVFIFIYSLSIFPSFQRWLSKKIDLSDFGYDNEVSLWKNGWESLAILIVMQLYSYERKQSKSTQSDYSYPMQQGVLGFFKRLLIWHSQKILFLALFYASLSPVSAFGFLYLFGLVIFSNSPKASQVPSKICVVYSMFLVIADYLFQMWGQRAKMFPGQKHYNIALLLGLRDFGLGFWALEAGLRGKLLVVAACTLQYNVFCWMEKVPHVHSDEGRWEEPCPLFVSGEDALPIVSIPNGDVRPPLDSLATRRMRITSNSRPSFSFESPLLSNEVPPDAGVPHGSNSKNHSFENIWGSSKESQKWNKKRIHALRRERFETQKTTLKIYLKYWMENAFNLFGLEINMFALLLASFAVLNGVSVLYIASLVACILLRRRIICKIWPIFVFLLASILILEYLALWRTVVTSDQRGQSDSDVQCHDCWSSSNSHFNYCRNCWLGFTVDDPRMLISYFIIFVLSCFKLRADRVSGISRSFTYRQVISQRKNAFVWRDLSYETKSMWTFLDYVKLYCYCHLLDLVLALLLITGTLEYDILHLGYLGFALVFFRIRLQILKKKNEIFKFLRIYNFGVIVLSLAYQSPFVGEYTAGKCATIDYMYEVIGFYKYDYGFKITSRSALVEIIIFVLVSLQSYMFSSQEFDYVFRYLEAEQIGAIVREQEKQAAWKKEQLQHVRESDEKKRQRNLQVEKMKSEMLNLQIQLHSTEPAVTRGDTSPHTHSVGMRRRDTSLHWNKDVEGHQEMKDNPIQGDSNINADTVSPSQFHEMFNDVYTESPTAHDYKKNLPGSPPCEIVELEDSTIDFTIDQEREKKPIREINENHLMSLLGDGVSHMHSFGNQAVTNFVSFLNLAPEDSDTSEYSSAEDTLYNEKETQDFSHFNNEETIQDARRVSLDHSSSVLSNRSRTKSDAATLQIGKIVRRIWSQMRSNNDIVCYCCFILVFLWNFSLLSMVYLAALYLYALCVNTGPNYIFWVIMLIYTEVYILLQYLYQIIIQHCGWEIKLDDSDILTEIGFPKSKIRYAFVVSLLPLFLLYLFTLLQSSITAKDGEWISSTEFSIGKQRDHVQKNVISNPNWTKRMEKLLKPVVDGGKMIYRSLSLYWKSLTRGAESPPYFVQMSLDAYVWPEDGIQPERIESAVNHLLLVVHDERSKEKNSNCCHSASRVHIQSIERSTENQNVAIAVFEVVYASPLIDCEPAEQYKSLTPATDVAEEILYAQRAGITEEIQFPYPILSVIGGGRRELDLYAYIFGADLAVFFLVAIFYQSVIENKSEFLEVYQLEDQFPKEFVFILLIIFFLIVLDRVIYLCSFAVFKVIFYLFSLVLFTYSVTEYAWNMDSSHRQAGGLALRAIYLTKAISLALQAIQIKYGVPHKSTLYKQFLTSKISQLNYIGYRLYRALPFLYELRCVLDWSCTTTSLTMYDWLKLEDINASLYLVKCDVVLNRNNHKQGEKQTKMTKFCSGICVFLVLMCIIWAPMLMYSSGNPTNIVNPIKDASVQLDIKTSGGRLTFFETTFCEIIPWDDLNTTKNLDPDNYLVTYNKDDIQLICCQPDASSLWLVPDVVLRRYSKTIDAESMVIIFTWILNRDRPKGKELVKYENSVKYPNVPDPSEIWDVLNGSTSSFRLRSTYPRLFRVTGSGDVRPFDPEKNDVSADLVIHGGSPEWWSFHDINGTDITACGGLAGPMAIIVSEETPQGFLGDTLSKFSIWSLYITFVLAVGRFIRLQCADLRMRIPYENLPSCDRLIAICEDIYAARAEGELGVEEVLYWTLIKIYRSPHMLLEYTKID